MKSTHYESESDIDEQLEIRREQLELARALDLLGRNAETFLTEQYQFLKRGIEEFEQEKAAWRRQLRRESSQLNRQREQLEQLRIELNEQSLQSDGRASIQNRRAASAIARASGVAPVRMLLRPEAATSMQIGMLMAEISRLNRETGGEGVRFVLREIRKSGRRLFRKHKSPAGCGKILRITAESVLPLKARGTHVALDEDVSDRREGWIAFKAKLLLSSLCDTDLSDEFESGRIVNDRASKELLKEAQRHVDAAGFPGPAESSRNLNPYVPYDSAELCFERLEDSYELLKTDHGLRIHLSSPKDE